MPCKAISAALIGDLCDTWLRAETAEALKLKLSQPGEYVSMIARGLRQDAGAVLAEGRLL